MSKNTFFSLITIIAVGLISCELLNRQHNSKIEVKEIKEQSHPDREYSLPVENRHQQNILIDEEKSPVMHDANSFVTQFDAALLDGQVRAEAELLGEDPVNYRMLRRSDPDGTKIFRMLGMHVIVNPNQEETFLPDQL